MLFVITGSLGHIGKPLTSQLRKEGHLVTVISSNSERIKEIEAIGATAAIGSVEDAGFLADAFRGADAIFTMVPPNYNGGDWKGWIATIGRNYVEAITSAGVKQVVNLSSIGAHMIDHCGPVSGLSQVELAMDAMAGVNVRHLRAGYFYTNFLNSIGQIKHQGIITGNYMADLNMVLAHPADIADIAARALMDESYLGRGFSYIASDEKTPAEIVTMIGKATEKFDLKWVERTDKEEFDDLVALGLPEETARNYTEMGAAMRSGEMNADYFRNRPVMAGWRSFESFLPDFAAAYNA
ncbi:MAG: NmrA family NAD(P)-binding protein [Chlorobaculum sp.]|nr:NmrA family NAD(P)-binding protein [Chlorobaculum sp.]